MAKVHQSSKDATSVLLDVFKNQLSANKAELKEEGYVNNLVGLESYNQFGSQRESRAKALSQGIVQTLQAEGLIKNASDLTPAQIEAANIVMMASGNTYAYARAAMDANFAPLGKGHSDAMLLTAGAHGASATPRDAGIGLEYFNDAHMDTHMAASVAFNLQAARQSSFCEAFFRTVTLDPSECGMMVEINKTVVFRSVRHAMHEKDSIGYNRRNILDAATDPTVLEDHSVQFVPYLNVDGSNASYFADPKFLAPVSRQVENSMVPTSALLFSADQRNLLSLSAHPALVTSGVLDESDEFDGRFALRRIYFSIKRKSETADKAMLIVRDVDNMPRSSFNKSQEGDNREMTLEFKDSMFMIGPDTKAMNGTAIPALGTMQNGNYSLKFTARVHGDVNLQTGLATVEAGKVSIISLVDANGDKISTTEGLGLDLVKDLDITAYCYDLKATRSASNRRNKGILVDEVGSHERYKIQLGTVITSRKPIGRVDNAAQVSNLISVARLSNDNAGITKLLNYTDALAEVVKTITPENEYEPAAIEGPGRHYVRAWYERQSFDAQAQTAALQSDDVPGAMRAALLNVIRDQVTRAFQESRFQPALEMLSGYTMSRPRVTIGTDIRTANWLWETGDLRTMGDAFEYEIVTTTDRRFKDRIQWVFTVGTEGFHVLNFGNFLWIPELVTDTNLTRNDAVANEITVQPRCYHVVNCPITGVIDVTGLSDLIQNKPSIGVTRKVTASDAITNTVLDTGA